MSEHGSESIGRLFRRISLPLAAGAALNQLNRAITAVIAPDIAEVFALSAADLGFLGAVFFAAYGFAQLPVGSALDRHGPRRVQAALMLSIAAGKACSNSSPPHTLFRQSCGIMVVRTNWMPSRPGGCCSAMTSEIALPQSPPCATYSV